MIIALFVFSVVLVIMEYHNRYCWLFILMVMGMAIAFFAISIHLTRFGNYYYSFNRLFGLDYSIFFYVGKTIKIPMTTLARVMNLGISLYLFSVPLFIYDFTYSNDFNIKKILLLFIPVIYNFLFYDPTNAYRIYISYNSGNSPAFYANSIYVLHQFNRVWLLVYLFYPVFLLCRYWAKNTIIFIKRQIVLLAICLGIMNLLFYSVFYMGPFMMSPAKAFVTGFWIFENIQIMFYRFYLIIFLAAVSVLLLTLLLLLNYRLGSLIHFFVDRKIQRNIFRMNELLSDSLHSQKNLFFSINILAQQAARQEDDIALLRKSVLKIQELSEDSLTRTSIMLDSLRAIRYNFKSNNMIAALDEAVSKTGLASNISIIWGGKSYDLGHIVCRFDYYHMVQVFINLLNNSTEAIGFAQRENGAIHINIATQFQWLFIIIQDNGIGIKKASIKRLFEPYFSEKTGGHNWGLGLSYAYRVIKAHWGQMRIESRYGEGSTVQIMLPISRNRGGHAENSHINRR